MIVNIEAYNRWADKQAQPIVQVYSDLANTFENLCIREDLTRDEILSLIHEAWDKYDREMKQLKDAHLWLWHPDVVSIRYLMQQAYHVLLMKWDL